METKQQNHGFASAHDFRRFLKDGYRGERRIAESGR
jgi:hypothetical protein